MRTMGDNHDLTESVNMFKSNSNEILTSRKKQDDASSIRQKEASVPSLHLKKS